MKNNHLSKANIAFTRLVVSFELLLLTLNVKVKIYVNQLQILPLTLCS